MNFSKIKLFFFISILILVHKLKLKKYENFKLKKKFKDEIKFIEKCLDEKVKIKKFEKYNNPYLSIIIPVYNVEIFLERILKSIQNQKLKEIEIIFVEDYSKDNSLKLLEEFSKKDKRIIIIKNKKSKGTLYSNVFGVLNSKGKFLVFSDPDDIFLSKMKLLYDISEKNDKDINDFSYIKGSLTEISEEIIHKDIEKYQPNLAEFIFSGSYIGPTHITKKIIKTAKMKKAVIKISNYFLNAHLITHADTLLFICTCLYLNSYKSYSNLFIQYYIKNQLSYTSKHELIYEEIFRVTIYLSRFIYEIKNCPVKILNIHINFIINLFYWPLNLSKQNKFFIEIEKINYFFKLLFQNKYINSENKVKLKILLNNIYLKCINSTNFEKIKRMY